MSNFAVAKVILDPKLPIHPRILRVSASQKTQVGQVIYANSITLTPGTVTLDVRNGHFSVHALTTDTDMQKSVQQVATAADQRNIETIAERVENANAMAVLFQLGVHYMQGHYVHEPEVVLQEPELGPAKTG